MNNSNHKKIISLVLASSLLTSAGSTSFAASSQLFGNSRNSNHGTNNTTNLSDKIVIDRITPYVRIDKNTKLYKLSNNAYKILSSSDIKFAQKSISETNKIIATVLVDQSVQSVITKNNTLSVTPKNSSTTRGDVSLKSINLQKLGILSYSGGAGLTSLLVKAGVSGGLAGVIGAAAGIYAVFVYESILANDIGQGTYVDISYGSTTGPMFYQHPNIYSVR